MRLPTVIMFMVGGVLIYSAVKDKNPLEVLRSGMQGKSAPSTAKAPAATAPSQPSPTGQVVTSV